MTVVTGQGDLSCVIQTDRAAGTTMEAHHFMKLVDLD